MYGVYGGEAIGGEEAVLVSSISASLVITLDLFPSHVQAVVQLEARIVNQC